jgi:energy-coupling factor transporter ATP-binding protein EcfA2
MTGTPSPSSRLPAWVLLLVATIGVPGAVAFALTDKIAQNPWLSLGLAVVYELVVVLTGFGLKVWSKLESRWVDRTADAVDIFLQSLFFRYRRRYLRYLVYACRDFDMKGLTTQGIHSLELQRVFVELSLVPRPPHAASSDPIHELPGELRRGGHIIWDFLHAASNQNIVVLGPPGSGKTTLLKHMVLTLASGAQACRQLRVPVKLPILLFLREHAVGIKDSSDKSLAEVIRDSLARQNIPPPPKGWIERGLDQGNCLVMLDGLDEVADADTRRAVVAWVERQMIASGSNRFVITSRPHGYRDNPLPGVSAVEVCPFNAEQVEKFVQNWYLANEVMTAQKEDEGVRMEAKNRAADFRSRLRRSQTLSALAINPLLLTMIATVHRFRGNLPGRRVELYAGICDVFLGRRQQARGLIVDLTPAQKRSVLQPMAYYMMSQRQRLLPIEEARSAIANQLAQVDPRADPDGFLKDIENASGLLVEREQGQYAFSHLTFQEYLASAHCVTARLVDDLLSHIDDDWWRETIRLYAAQADATAIIAACQAIASTSVPALALAIECQDEALQVEPHQRASLSELLDAGINAPEPERRRLVAETLLTLRIRRMARADNAREADDSLLTNAEYQLFLDDTSFQGRHHQPDQWMSKQFPAGRGRDPVIGLRSSDAVAFCDWLTGRIGTNSRYSNPIGLKFLRFQLSMLPTIRGIGRIRMGRTALRCLGTQR